MRTHEPVSLRTYTPRSPDQESRFDQELTIGVDTRFGTEEIHVLRSGSEGPECFLVWHGFDSVNRFYSWDWLLPYGEVIRAGLPGHGPVARRSWRQYRSWPPGHFLDTAATLSRRLYSGTGLTVVGHSAGAQCALGVALREPGLVRRVILINPLVWPLRQSPVARRAVIRSPLWPFFGAAILGWGHRRKRRSVDRHLAASGPIVADPERFCRSPRCRMYVESGFGDYRCTGLAALVGAIRVLSRSDLRAEIAAVPIRVPALVVHGQEDRLCPIGQSEWLVRHWPQATLVAMAGVGHIGYAEREQEFIDEVVGWLDRQIGGGV